MDNTTFALMLMQAIMVMLFSIAALGVIIAFYLSKIYRQVYRSGMPMIGAEARSAMPNATDSPVGSSIVAPMPGVRRNETVESPRSIEVLESTTDIMKNFQSLRDKYYLDAFTLATNDGLVVASSDRDAQADAAQYSQVFTLGEKPTDPAVRLFGMSHQGSSLVGIIKTNRSIPDSWMKSIEDDAKRILNWWL
jgi:hypothetical protein